MADLERVAFGVSVEAQIVVTRAAGALMECSERTDGGAEPTLLTGSSGNDLESSAHAFRDHDVALPPIGHARECPSAIP